VLLNHIYKLSINAFFPLSHLTTWMGVNSVHHMAKFGMPQRGQQMYAERNPCGVFSQLLLLCIRNSELCCWAKYVAVNSIKYRNCWRIKRIVFEKHMSSLTIWNLPGPQVKCPTFFFSFDLTWVLLCLYILLVIHSIKCHVNLLSGSRVDMYVRTWH
jgi:hypothetical protein